MSSKFDVGIQIGPSGGPTGYILQSMQIDQAMDHTLAKAAPKVVAPPPPTMRSYGEIRHPATETVDDKGAWRLRHQGSTHTLSGMTGNLGVLYIYIIIILYIYIIIYNYNIIILYNI